MPDQVSPVSEFECGMCGIDGGPRPECELCHGSVRYRQKRHFTLSEERQGLNPNPGNRYGRNGEVGPRIAVVPGGMDPGKPKGE